MSIIYDALKKTQSNRHSYITITPAEANDFNQTYLTWGVLTLLIIALMTTCIYLVHTGKVNFFPKLARNIVYDLKGKANSPLPSMLAISKPSMPVKVASSRHLILDGVFISESNKIAVINHQPLNIGDSIAGLKIVSIEINKVKLQNANQLIELHNVV